MKIEEQIFEWFNLEDYTGRQEVVKTLKQISKQLEEQLINTCPNCLNAFEDCDCKNSNK